MKRRIIHRRSVFIAFAIALTAVFAVSRHADASQYAIAWDGAVPKCKNLPGNECDDPET